MLFVLTSFAVQAKNRAISGKVTDARNEPLIGVNVSVKGTTIGTVTDLNGKYILQVPEEQKSLLFTYVGFTSMTEPIGIRSVVNVVLKEDAKNLDEVVVVGYQTMKRKDLTGPIASVSGKTIATAPVANIAQALQGKLSGVNVISQDGRPNASVSIRVRGGGSISQSNDALVLIDGIPGTLSDIPADQVESVDVLKDASSTAIYGAAGANGVVLVTTKGAKEGKTTVSYNNYVKFNRPTKYLNSMSPYDYLKYVWANSTANSVTSSTATGNAYSLPFEKLFGLGANAGTNTGGIESYRNLASDDIQRDVYNSSTSWNHDFTITGGTDKTKVLFSANYLDDQGMKVNSYAKRANVSLKVKQKLTHNTEFGLDARYTDDSSLGNEGTTNGSGSLLSSSYRFRPIASSHILGDMSALRTGNIEQYGKSSMWDTYSPLARIADYDPLSIKQAVNTAATFNWQIVKGLSYRTELDLSRSWNQTKEWSGAIYNNYVEDATGTHLWAGAANYQKSDRWGLRWSNVLNYQNTFSKIHQVNLMAGQEVTNSGGTSMSISANHFPTNFTKENAFAMINQYDPATGTSSFSTSVNTPERQTSYFGRSSYTLMDRYLFTFTFRADASSKFSPLHRWGYFPAGAVAWRLTEEPFMKKINWLDNLKLRFSYGQVGNNGINSGLWSQTWASVSDKRWQYDLNHQYQSSYDYKYTTVMPNQDLKWETTITRNIGLDFSVLKNLLSGTVELYKNTTKDLLMQTSISGITGYTTTFANIGQTSNKGLEISLSATLFKNRDWNVTANGNINFNRNNVDALAPNVQGQYTTYWASSSTQPTNDYILKVGSPVGLVRGYVYDGFYTTDDFTYANGIYTLKPGVPDLTSFIGALHGIGSGSVDRPTGQIAYPGLPKYKNLDNSDNVINEKDVTVIGNMNPKHTGGFNFNITYKQLDLGAYFNWSYGNQVYNLTKLASLSGPKEGGVYENKLSILNNAYKIYDVVDGQLVRLTTPEQLSAANMNASLPLAYNEGGVTSSLAIEDGSYLRLNTLTLGYTLPKNLTKKAGISSLRIYGSIYNVLTITGYSGLDPEVNTNTSQNNAIYPTIGLDWGTYPRARSFVVGVNLNF
jgi:TonB-linked outer membrane protein, SusC/RagA family